MFLFGTSVPVEILVVPVEIPVCPVKMPVDSCRRLFPVEFPVAFYVVNSCSAVCHSFVGEKLQEFREFPVVPV